MVTSDGFLKNIDLFFSVLLLFVLTGVIVLQVVMRYILLMPQAWTGELARLLHAAIAFLGLARVEWQNKHVQISFFRDKFIPPNLNDFFDVVFLFLKLFVAIIILIGSFQVIMEAGYMLSVGMGIPVTFFYLPNIIGFGLFAMTLLWKIGLRFKIFNISKNNKEN